MKLLLLLSTLSLASTQESLDFLRTIKAEEMKLKFRHDPSNTLIKRSNSILSKCFKDIKNDHGLKKIGRIIDTLILSGSYFELNGVDINEKLTPDKYDMKISFRISYDECYKKLSSHIESN